MHHVVFAVAPHRLDAAVAFLEAFGFRFQTHELADVGLLVKLDWERGVEIVTPMSADATISDSVADFLAVHGDGVFSVVMRVDDADASAELARRYGASAEFRQDRSGDGLDLVEVQLASIFGMPLTLLSTNLP
jgi:4-hydroxyphenylpyruvate dioxygenase-like putative hemolysin